VTLMLAVSRSRPSVPYGANFLVCHFSGSVLEQMEEGSRRGNYQTQTHLISWHRPVWLRLRSHMLLGEVGTTRLWPSQDFWRSQTPANSRQLKCRL